MMDYWVQRIWIYSIPALCVLASIGSIEILNQYKIKMIYRKYKHLKPITKNFFSVNLILFSIIL